MYRVAALSVCGVGGEFINGISVLVSFPAAAQSLSQSASPPLRVLFSLTESLQEQTTSVLCVDLVGHDSRLYCM